jgi:hypothetical protein
MLDEGQVIIASMEIGIVVHAKKMDKSAFDNFCLCIRVGMKGCTIVKLSSNIDKKGFPKVTNELRGCN